MIFMNKGRKFAAIYSQFTYSKPCIYAANVCESDLRTKVI